MVDDDDSHSSDGIGTKRRSDEGGTGVQRKKWRFMSEEEVHYVRSLTGRPMPTLTLGADGLVRCGETGASMLLSEFRTSWLPSVAAMCGFDLVPRPPQLVPTATGTAAAAEALTELRAEVHVLTVRRKPRGVE